MSTSDRRPYETATVLDQELLDNSHDNLACDLRMVAEIDGPNGTIRLSDRNTYKGDLFYPALVTFPIIERTVGEWLSPQIEFSLLDLNNINNVDGRFNNILPQGADYDGWIGRSVRILIGLRDVESTYFTIFTGFVAPIKGFTRSVQSFGINARDRLDKINNAKFPNNVFKEVDFPTIENNYLGKQKGVIYGRWDEEQFLNKVTASIPATPVNGLDPNVKGGTRNNVKYVISETANTSFDATNVWVKRGDKFFQFVAADIIPTGVDNNTFEINQLGVSLIDGALWEFSSADNIFVRVVGKELGGGTYTNNAVEICRDILKTYAGAVDADFDATWDYFRDKAAPAESAVSLIKARAYINSSQDAMQYVLSILEQVRLESFINKDLKLSVRSLHFDEFIAPGAITHTIRATDVVEDSLQISLDERNNINKGRARYNFLPDLKENYFDTSFYLNQAAITQSGVEVSKDFSFPNLYDDTSGDVTNQLREMLKLSSSGFADVRVEFTWRSILLDIGDFVKFNLNIGSTEFDNTPMIMRQIGYDPEGIKITARLFDLQLVPYDGYNPGYSGIVGGSTATITEE